MPLRILHLENNPGDADLIAATLGSEGLDCEIVRVASAAQFLTALDGSYDLILADFGVPGFNGVAAQRLAYERHPDVPFVFVSGTMGEEVAIERLQEGATDFVLKQSLHRLPSAVRRALQEAHDRRERHKAESDVRRLNAELEERVVERTAQLARANASLHEREAELEQAKAFLEHLVASSPSMIFRVDPQDLRASYVSPNIGWLLGYTPQEVIGVPGFWEAIIHPDDRARVVGRIRAAIDDTVAQLQQEYRCRGKDGRYRWFFNLLRIEYDAAARPIGILGYALDIADRKAAEAEVLQANAFLGSIIESLPVTLFVKDAADLRYVRFNRAGEELLGIPRAEIIGRTDAQIFPTRDAEALQILDRSVLAGHAVVDIPEQVLPTRSRGTRILHTRKLPIVDSTGVPRYLLGIAEDITERKMAEEDARLARLEAERANLAKSEFLSRMSHDLRTPLNAVIGFAQLLALEALPDQQRESVTQILNGGRHLLDLINEVLDVTRIEAGRLSLTPQSVPVADIVHEVVDLLAPLARQRRIAVQVNIDRAHELFARADRQRLKQVLLNLVGNAVKYNRENGRVEVNCEARPAERITISVADTGVGIPLEKMKLLFRPFERLGAEHTSVEGTGLGLAVSKALTEAMGGAIGVRSDVGHGTTFWIELPAADSSPATPVDGDSRPLRRATSGTVLYIEDNPANVRLMIRILGRREGVRLLTAPSGRVGLQMVSEQRPDLILLDLHLPDMSGEDVLHHIRGDAAMRGIPVAILSADATPRQVERILAAGSVAYLTKPLEIGQLLHLVDERLGQRGGLLRERGE